MTYRTYSGRILKVSPNSFYAGGTQYRLCCLIEPGYRQARYRPIPVQDIQRLLSAIVGSAEHIYQAAA